MLQKTGLNASFNDRSISIHAGCLKMLRDLNHKSVTAKRLHRQKHEPAFMLQFFTDQKIQSESLVHATKNIHMFKPLRDVSNPVSCACAHDTRLQTLCFLKAFIHPHPHSCRHLIIRIGYTNTIMPVPRTMRLFVELYGHMLAFIKISPFTDQ